MNENPKTIRLIYSSDLKYIDKYNAKYEIFNVLNPINNVIYNVF